MTEKALKKENQALRLEVQKLSDEMKNLQESFNKISNGGQACNADRDASTSLQFLSDQYDDMDQFKRQALQQLKSLSSRLADISAKSDRISAAIDAMQQYSYQYNVKIVGVPAVSDQETSVQTANLCLKLFSALGVSEIDIKDLDTAHRVPAREASNRPNAINMQIYKQADTRQGHGQEECS